MGLQDRRRFLASLLATPFAWRLGLKTSDGLAPRLVRAKDHVVVVGAGAFGGWTALALLRLGFRVTLVDAWGAGHSRASSGGETRVIRAVYGGEPVYSQMAARALTLWREAEKHWNQRVYFRTGVLWMCAADDAFVTRSMAPMAAVGLSLQPIAIADAVRRYPQMSFADVRAVYFEPEAGYLTARVACELVRETFVREGGDYRVSWLELRPSRGGRVSSGSLSDGSTLGADRFVFACGPWMGQVFPEVVGRRIVATRQDVFFFGVPAGSTLFDASAVPVWVHLGDRIFYGVPGNQRRGLKIADDTAGPEVNPTTMEREPDRAALALARRALRDRFPALGEAPLLESRVCQYEASSDGNFLVDRHPELENVWLVGGGSGHGFKMGPALGQHAAGVVAGTLNVHPLFAYSRLRPRPAIPDV